MPHNIKIYIYIYIDNVKSIFYTDHSKTDNRPDLTHGPIADASMGSWVRFVCYSCPILSVVLIPCHLHVSLYKEAGY